RDERDARLIAEGGEVVDAREPDHPMPRVVLLAFGSVPVCEPAGQPASQPELGRPRGIGQITTEREAGRRYYAVVGDHRRGFYSVVGQSGAGSWPSRLTSASSAAVPACVRSAGGAVVESSHEQMRTRCSEGRLQDVGERRGQGRVREGWRPGRGSCPGTSRAPGGSPAAAPWGAPPALGIAP